MFSEVVFLREGIDQLSRRCCELGARQSAYGAIERNSGGARFKERG
jgi:hypothetical protein